MNTAATTTANTAKTLSVSLTPAELLAAITARYPHGSPVAAPRHDHVWSGPSVRRVSLCLPSSVRHRVTEINAVRGALTRVFEIGRELIAERYADELVLTVYTGEGRGHTDDEAALWGLRWTRGLWDGLQAEADAKALAKAKAAVGGGQ